MKQPLLSIVIPTRNRQYYCIESIKNILSYKNEDFELCIQDNSDNNEIEKYIKDNINDNRLIYKYVATPLASIFNMDEAINLASGKYVLFIGDDDTILPNVFDIVSWMDRMEYDSVCSNSYVTYFWPGSRNGYNCGLVIMPKYENITTMVNVPKNLKKLFRNGILNYMDYNLPKVYHGIVLRERLLEIKEKTGRYYHGLSPDISACVSLSTVVRRHVLIKYPITVAGACRMSSTAQSYNHGHKGMLEDAPHFHLRGEYKWNCMVPKFYSVETIWADTALNTALLLNRQDLVKSFRYGRFSAYALLKNREIFAYALKNILSASPYLKIFLLAELFAYSVYFSIPILVKKCIKKKSVNHCIENCNNISEAVRLYLDYIKNNS